MAADAFIKFKDINGSSTDKKHEKWVDVMSYSHSMHQPTDPCSKNTARVSMGTFEFTKQMDLSTTGLMKACTAGTNIGEVIVELCHSSGKDGADKVPYMKIKLENVIVSGYNVNGGGEEWPTENISLAFSKITWDFAAQDVTGRHIGNTSASWNLATNQAS